MEAASSIGGLLPAAAIAMAIFAWLLYKKRSAECWLSAGALLSLAAIPILKFLVDRPRPTEDMVEVTHRIGGLSFPSGHAFTAVVIFGLLYYLAPLLIPWRMGVRIVRMSLLLLVLLIGMSRVYLGVHWPSDVFGGFLFGAITLALLIHLHRQQSSRGEVSQTT